jgi:sugar lactone lactonase YvrE
MSTVLSLTSLWSLYRRSRAGGTYFIRRGATNRCMNVSYTPLSGRVLETHPVPVDRPTNCIFGDAGLRTLYITTGGGHLYRVRNIERQGLLLFPMVRVS